MASKSLFFPAKHKNLSEIVSLRSPDDAKESIRLLKREFQGAKTREKRLRIAGATRLAANRARASAKRSSLSDSERVQFKDIAKMYDVEASSFYRHLGGS